MIELRRDSLTISFPEVHEDASMTIDFQRTLRIPDDDKVHFLPPGLGGFPLRHIDDFADRIPGSWREHGGVMLPMFQSEALWLNFSNVNGYPFLLKIATGKINAVTGEKWVDVPNRDPQDYVVVPGQPWLDGYCVDKGEIRQFVAMPLGKGYTTEEQLTGQAEHGGIQIVAYPLKAKVWQERLDNEPPQLFGENCSHSLLSVRECSMGLAPGGRMKQDIDVDSHPMEAWDLRHRSRCFVHIANSLNWRAITGEAPPTLPPTAAQYSEAGLPWFDYYGDGEAVEGSVALNGVTTVKNMAAAKDEAALPENDPVAVKTVIKLGDRKGDVVREGL